MRSPLEATELQLHDDTEASIRAALDDREAAMAWESGKTLSLDDALSLAPASLD